MIFTLADIAAQLGGQLHGDADCKVDRIATLANAAKGCISFLTNPKYRDQVAETQASAVLIHPNELAFCQANSQASVIVLANPYLGYAQLAKIMDSTPKQQVGIAASAVVDDSAVVAQTASIGEQVVICAGAVIEAYAVIGHGCVVGQNSVIGHHSRLWANVSVYHNVTIGEQCLIQSGAIIGSDGFGYAPDNKQWIKIPQLGGVSIGDRVEIGANTCIDRGALDDTMISDGVIIDNQCHIAHNVFIGENTAMAAGSMIAGSTSVGANCTIAGKVGIAGHLSITDNVMLTAMTMVIKDISKPGAYSSGMASIPNNEWRKSNARMRQLDDMYQKIRRHDKAITSLVESTEQATK